MKINYALALQTPTIVIPVTAKDSAGNTDKFKVEYKRYGLEESKEKLKAFDDLYTDFNEFTTTSMENPSPEEMELRKGKLQAIMDKLNEDLKIFTKNEVVSFQDIKCRDASGKLVATIKNTETEGANMEQWGEASNCTPAWFEHFWSSNPYKEAIHNGMLSAIRNTASK